MSKRGNNEGSIYKRADGRWTATVNLGYEDGKRKRKSLYAQPPPAPSHPSLTPEKAVADAAHFYGKEDPVPYRTK